MGKDTTKSTLAHYLNPLDSKRMSQEIKSLGLDRYTKKLDSIRFLNLLVFAQVHQVGSLTDLSALLGENPELQSEIGFQSISKSQLSRKLAQTDTRFFESVWKRCASRVIRAVGTKKAMHQLGCIHLIDSSTITMCLSQYPWAKFARGKAGVKLHLRLAFTNGLALPDKAVLTQARPSDRSQMDNLVQCETDALYIFDRGYVDYRKFDEYCEHGTRFVTRLRENASIMQVYEERLIPQGTGVLRDAVVQLGSAFRSMTNRTRWIEIIDSEGRQIIILTNDLTMDTVEICDLYRKRWQIELFFKWIKQHLKVKNFYGKSENAVYNQLYVALIAYCLLVLMQQKAKHRGRLLDIYRCVQRHWAKAFEEFIKYIARPPSRKSSGRRRVDYERAFAQTLKQYECGEVEHLEDLMYDPI